jgi:hypothetical protein
MLDHRAYPSTAILSAKGQVITEKGGLGLSTEPAKVELSVYRSFPEDEADDRIQILDHNVISRRRYAKCLDVRSEWSNGNGGIHAFGHDLVWIPDVLERVEGGNARRKGAEVLPGVTISERIPKERKVMPQLLLEIVCRY